MSDKALLFFYQLASSHLFFPLPAAASLHAFLLLVPSVPFPWRCFPGTCSSSTLPGPPATHQQPAWALTHISCRSCPPVPAQTLQIPVLVCGHCLLRVQGAVKWHTISPDAQRNWLFGRAYLGETPGALVPIFWKLILSLLNLILSALVFLTDSFLKHQVVA